MKSYSGMHLSEELEFGQRGKLPVGPTIWAPQAKWETCEIRDVEGLRASEGYVRCHWFQAYATGPNKNYVAAESPGFYCPQSTPEPEYARKQHSALVARLLMEGWEPVGEAGPGWWRMQFRRSVS
jgi:hypothetical protein